MPDRRLMYGDFFGRLAQIFQLHNFMVLEAAHVPVGIVTAGTQEISAIIAPRDGHFLALARSASQH